MLSIATIHSLCDQSVSRFYVITVSKWLIEFDSVQEFNTVSTNRESILELYDTYLLELQGSDRFDAPKLVYIQRSQLLFNILLYTKPITDVIPLA